MSSIAIYITHSMLRKHISQQTIISHFISICLYKEFIYVICLYKEFIYLFNTCINLTIISWWPYYRKCGTFNFSQNRRIYSIYAGPCCNREVSRLLANEEDSHLVDCNKMEAKGPYGVEIRSTYFFTVIFTNLEDINHVFDNDPYFSNLVGLYLWD